MTDQIIEHIEMMRNATDEDWRKFDLWRKMIRERLSRSEAEEIVNRLLLLSDDYNNNIRDAVASILKSISIPDNLLPIVISRMIRMATKDSYVWARYRAVLILNDYLDRPEVSNTLKLVAENDSEKEVRDAACLASEGLD